MTIRGSRLQTSINCRLLYAWAAMSSYVRLVWYIINDSIENETEQKILLCSKLTQGMAYLHKSPFQSHGKLSSSKCLVDSRWVLKISGIGLSAFEDEKTDKSDNEKYRDLLWTAPELLRMKPSPVYGTQKGDVYSFAIVLQEILYRTFPYSSMDLEYKGLAQVLLPLLFNTIFVSSHMYPETRRYPSNRRLNEHGIYIRGTAKNRTHNLCRPKREPIPLGHNDITFVMSWLSNVNL